MTRKLKSAEIAVEKLTLANRKKIDAAKAAKQALDASGISTAKLGAHERELATKIDAANAAMQRQQDKLAKLSAMQNRQRNARSKYEQSLENRDRLAGAGAATTAAGTAVGLPIVKMIRDYSSYEDAMLGVARQVDGARDANGKLTPLTTRWAMPSRPCRKRSRWPPPRLPPWWRAARGWASRARTTCSPSPTAALASTAFDLPAEQISEDLGKIANTYRSRSRTSSSWATSSATWMTTHSPRALTSST
jgi:phage-related tail protein